MQLKLKESNNHDFVHVAKYTCSKIANLNINKNSFDHNFKKIQTCP